MSSVTFLSHLIIIAWQLLWHVVLLFRWHNEKQNVEIIQPVFFVKFYLWFVIIRDYVIRVHKYWTTFLNIYDIPLYQIDLLYLRFFYSARNELRSIIVFNWSNKFTGDSSFSKTHFFNNIGFVYILGLSLIFKKWVLKSILNILLFYIIH